MSALLAASTLIAVVIGCCAGICFWIFQQRRQEMGLLWLGIACLGALANVLATAFLYRSTSAEMALWLRTVLTLLVLPFLVGMIRFTEHFLAASLRRSERLCVAGIIGFAVSPLVLGLYHPHAVTRQIHWLDVSYVDVANTPIGAVASLIFLAIAFHLFALYRLRLDRLEAARGPAVSAAAVWLLCATNDVAVGTGALEAPFLHGMGNAGLLVILTGAMLHRFVISMEQVEVSTDQLQRAAEERAAELREKDLQLAQGERMATLGTLAAGLAHEINNPIAFITANLNQLPELWKSPETSDEFDEVLDETRDGVNRIRGIVADLLGMARHDEGSMAPLDLAEVVRSVLPPVRRQLPQGVRLETELQPVPVVWGEERLLGQVALNLVLNAIQAIPPEAGNGIVRVCTTFDEERVTLCVSDTGSGIPSAVLPRIFDPFFTTKALGEGTGLGLAVTQQIVRSHGGRVHVETRPGATSIRVRLPRHREARPQPEADSDQRR